MNIEYIDNEDNIDQEFKKIIKIKIPDDAYALDLWYEDEFYSSKNNDCILIHNNELLVYSYKNSKLYSEFYTKRDYLKQNLISEEANNTCGQVPRIIISEINSTSKIVNGKIYINNKNWNNYYEEFRWLTDNYLNNEDKSRLIKEWKQLRSKMGIIKIKELIDTLIRLAKFFSTRKKSILLSDCINEKI